VNLGDKTHVFSCTSDGDCGGDGFKCAIPPMGNIGSCCKPTGAEVCNGIDDDCNGLVDDGFPAEICNGKDDNCNGQVDEGFDLNNDPNNCGMCMRACGLNQICLQGGCVARGETDCNDGIDNDNNGKIDCADSACEGSECGVGCVCTNMVKVESDCADGKDNDGDGQTDCADTDCGGVHCQAPPSTFTCSAGGTCDCNGGAATPEDGGASCRDGLDNDCNGAADCADQKCDLAQCALDGGQGCQCANHVPTETNCRDLVDNDSDGLTDCEDFMDCPAPVNCTVVLDGGGTKNGNCSATDHQCH